MLAGLVSRVGVFVPGTATDRISKSKASTSLDEAEFDCTSLGHEVAEMEIKSYYVQRYSHKALEHCSACHGRERRTNDLQTANKLQVNIIANTLAICRDA